MTTVENVLLAFQGADQGAGSLISSLGTNMLGLGRNVNDVGNRFKKMGVDVKGAMMMASGAAIGTGYVYFLQQAAQAAAAGEQNWTRFAVSMGATSMQTTAFREQYGALVTEVHNSTGRMKGDIVNTFADLAKAGVRSNEVLKESVEAMSGVAMLTGKTLDEVEKSWVKILERPTMMTKSLLSAGINVNAFNQVLKTHNLTIEEWGRLTVEQRANLLNEAAALMGASEANAAYKQTAEGMWNLLNQQWKTFMTDIGYAILPLLVELGNTFLPILTGMVQGFTRLDPHLKMFLLLLPLMFAGVMTLGGAFLLMKTTLGGAGGLITLFADVVKYLMAITTESASAAAGIETVNAASAFGGVVNRGGLGQNARGSGAISGLSKLELLGAASIAIAGAATIYLLGTALQKGQERYAQAPQPVTSEGIAVKRIIDSLPGKLASDYLIGTPFKYAQLGVEAKPGDPLGALVSGLGMFGSDFASALGLTGGTAYAAKPGEDKQGGFWGAKGPFSYKEWLPEGEKAIQDGTKRIIDDFKNLPNRAKSALSGMEKGIGTPINSALDSAKNIVGGGVNWITTSFWGGVNTVTSAFWSLPGQVGGAMQSMYNTIVGWTNSAIGMLRSLYCIIFGCSPGLIPAFRALAREAPVHTATAIAGVKELQGEIKAVPDISIKDTGNSSTGRATHYHSGDIYIDARDKSNDEIKRILIDIFENPN
jgi:hypothetical protein